MVLHWHPRCQVTIHKSSLWHGDVVWSKRFLQSVGPWIFGNRRIQKNPPKNGPQNWIIGYQTMVSGGVFANIEGERFILELAPILCYRSLTPILILRTLRPRHPRSRNANPAARIAPPLRHRHQASSSFQIRFEAHKLSFSPHLKHELNMSWIRSCAQLSQLGTSIYDTLIFGVSMYLPIGGNWKQQLMLCAHELQQLASTDNATTITTQPAGCQECFDQKNQKTFVSVMIAVSCILQDIMFTLW